MGLTAKIEGMGEEGFDGFSFWLKASSSETNTNKELVIASPVIAV